jgi:hypothetical protein
VKIHRNTRYLVPPDVPPEVPEDPPEVPPPEVPVPVPVPVPLAGSPLVLAPAPPARSAPAPRLLSWLPLVPVPLVPVSELVRPAPVPVPEPVPAPAPVPVVLVPLPVVPDGLADVPLPLDPLVPLLPLPLPEPVLLPESQPKFSAPTASAAAANNPAVSLSRMSDLLVGPRVRARNGCPRAPAHRRAVADSARKVDAFCPIVPEILNGTEVVEGAGFVKGVSDP